MVQVKHIKKGDGSEVEYVVTRDECNRPDTSMEGLRNLAPIRELGDPAATTTAGNASQLSDGASACVLMDEVGGRLV